MRCDVLVDVDEKWVYAEKPGVYVKRIDNTYGWRRGSAFNTGAGPPAAGLSVNASLDCTDMLVACGERESGFCGDGAGQAGLYSPFSGVIVPREAGCRAGRM